MLKKAQRIQAVDAAFALLFGIGLRKRVTRWFDFKGTLEQKLNYKLSDAEYSGILRSVNALSWEKHRCLFTALIICSNCLPGQPLFKKAHNLGAIPVLPDEDDLSELKLLAGKLQAQVYEAVDKAQGLQSAQTPTKAPTLF